MSFWQKLQYIIYRRTVMFPLLFLLVVLVAGLSYADLTLGITINPAQIIPITKPTSTPSPTPTPTTNPQAQGYHDLKVKPYPNLPVDAETVNWKNYGYGNVSIKYPEGLYLDDKSYYDASKQQPIVDFRILDYNPLSPTPSTDHASGITINITTSTYTDNTIAELKSELSKYTNPLPNGLGQPQVATESAYLINGNSALYQNLVYKGGSEQEKIYILTGNNTDYEITSNEFNGGNSPLKNQVIAQIASTFTVLEPSQIGKVVDTDTNTANWKTYKSPDNMYFIKFPESWFINGYGLEANSVSFSNVQNDPNIVYGMCDDCIRVQVNYYIGDMPTTFSYTNGASTNDTIKPFSINNLSGIRGQETSVAGLQDVIYLKNPDDKRYAVIVLTPPQKANQDLAEQVLNSMLSSLSFPTSH